MTRTATWGFAALALLGLAAFAFFMPAPHPADLILQGATVWTGDPDRPEASAVAVRDREIVAVGSDAEMEPFRGSDTRVLDLEGRFVAPGFIDNHTHFGRAGALLLGVNLLDVDSEAGLVREVRAARDRLPEGAWITGGDWGAYAEWAQGSAGEGPGSADAAGGAAPGAQGGAPAAQPAFRPHRAMIDSITPETPVVLSRWDGEAYLANGRALEVAGLTCAWAGVECEAGRPTGRITPQMAERILELRPERSMERRLAEADTAQDRLLASGVTSFHDVTPEDQLRVFQELKRRDALRVRVYARPLLTSWDELRAVGIEQGFGDRWLRVGTLKGFVDGIMGNSSARFYEPYLHTGELGEWRDMITQPPGMEELLVGADSAGFWFGVHAIGDRAIDELLTMYERMLERNGAVAADGAGGGATGVGADAGDAASGPAERRHRVIHTQVLRDSTVADRIAELGLIAEMQPYHAIDDMRWMEERIGPERSRWAYAFRTLDDAGVRLSFGSDWPGTNAAWYPSSPLLGIYAALTRKTLTGEPEGGWFPEERVDVETALRAYTVNNAYAEGTEDEKGSIREGKLADLVVLDRSPFEVPADSLKDLRVLHTIVEGEVAFEASPEEARAAVHWANRPE